jgi:adenosylhomocysteine nucleosidase
LASAAVNEALRERRNVDGIVSTGFCGALDPALCVGDIVVSGDGVASPRAFVRGEILSMDRVAVTAVEKRDLRERTGAVAIEMESAAVAAKAREWGVPFRCIKAVSDTAAEDLPLDFNLYRDPAGRFSRSRIALAAMRSPLTAIPALLRLDRNCRHAADKLGEFFADCQL